MSFLVDVMLGVSILGLILGLIFTSYQNCRAHADAQDSKRKLMIQLATDHVITDQELQNYPAIKAKFDEIFSGAKYKVSRNEAKLSKEILSTKAEGVSYVATDMSGNIIEIESLQKPTRGYLWGAISD